MNGYAYLDTKYSNALVSFAESVETTTHITGLYERLEELLNTAKMLFISGEVHSSDTGTSKFVIPISIISITTGITISFNISDTSYAFIIDKNTVAKLGG